MGLENNLDENKGIINRLDRAAMWANNKLFDLWGKMGYERTSLQKALYSASLGLFAYQFVYGNLAAGFMGFLAYNNLMNADTKEEIRHSLSKPTKFMKFGSLTIYAIGGLIISGGIAKAVSSGNDNQEMMKGIDLVLNGLSLCMYFTAVNSQRPDARTFEKKDKEEF